MIQNNIFRRYFIIVIAIIGLFIFLGSTLMRLIAKSHQFDRPEAIAPVFIAKIIDNLNFSNKVDAIKALETWQLETFSPKLVLFNNKREILYASVEFKKEWLPSYEQLKKLDHDYAYVKYDNPIGFRFERVPPPDFGIGSPHLGQKNNSSQANNSPPMPPPPEDGPNGLAPPPPPRGNEPSGFGPHQIIQDIAVRLKSPKEPLYLLILSVPPSPSEMSKLSLNSKSTNTTSNWFNPRYMPYVGLGFLVVSLIFGVAIALTVIYYSVKKRVVEADKVITDLQKGNLKSRFKVERDDEFGHAMMRFNYMADQIEKLVTGLKEAEISRTKLLQELAHDLRTPIAALKTLNETLDMRMEVLPKETQKELLQLSKKEIDYFARLVEDLLLLSQVSEPKYHTQQAEINIIELVQTEADEIDLRAQSQGLNKTVQVFNSGLLQNYNILGEGKLLQRMFRNLIENALSFSRSQVTIQIKLLEDQKLEIEIQDDGQGFDDYSLHHFGERKISRQLQTYDEKNSRLSVGLGSVIVKKICEVHEGHLEVFNRIDQNGRVLGASVRLRFSSRASTTKSAI